MDRDKIFSIILQTVKANSCDMPDQSDLADLAEAVLHDLTASGFMIVEGWRTVDSAPKDKTHILGYNGEYMFTMYWHLSLSEWQLVVAGSWAEDGDIFPKPTHWMPLPSPPKSTDDSKEAESMKGKTANVTFCDL